MLAAKLLNSGASLNNFLIVNAVDFNPGENLTLNIQLYDADLDIRYIPPDTTLVSMSFMDNNTNTIVKSATEISVDDRSMWSVQLAQADTLIIAGQNIIVTIDVNGDGSVIYLALINNGLIRNNLSGDC